MSFSTSVDSLFTPVAESYTARAAIGNGGVDVASTTVTGNRSASLFAPQKALGKQEFLQLLVKQLQYQDPLSPMENTEFVSQLAQFSALEGSTNIEAAINKLDSSFASAVDSQNYSARSITNSSAISLIGKEVRLQMNSVRYNGPGDDPVNLRIHLGDASGAAVSIVNSDGVTVKTLRTSGKDSENSTSITWNGDTDQGTIAPSGVYSVVIEGAEANSALYAFVQDVVQGVRFSADGPLAKVNGREISIANILDVSIGQNGAGGELSPASNLALLGKSVRWRNDSVTFAGPGSTLQSSVNMGTRSQVTVEVLNSRGVVLSTQRVEGSNGVGVVRWDGMRADGSGYAPAGSYTLRVTGSQNDSSLYCFGEGVVDGVSMLDGTTHLRVGDRQVSIGQIIDIASGKESGGVV